MKVTSQEIRDRLTGIWPDLEYIWLWDTTYWMPTADSVQLALKNSNVPTMDFVDEFNDCDNFALQFLAECRRKRYFQWKAGDLDKEQRYSMSIGFVFGEQFRGIGKLHAANIALCSDGDVYIIDTIPAENRMWLATPDKDSILFVFM